MLRHLRFKGGSIRTPTHPKCMVDFVVLGLHCDPLVDHLGLCLTQDLHEANAFIILFLFLFLTLLHDLIACSIEGGEFLTQNSGFKSTRLCPLIYLGCLFSLSQHMVLFPPLPPPIFTCVPCPTAQISRTLSLFPFSFISVRFCLFDRPPPAAPVVSCRPSVGSIQPSD